MDDLYAFTAEVVHFYYTYQRGGRQKVLSTTKQFGGNAMCREISYDDYEFSTRSLSEMWAELAKNHQETEWKMFPRTSRLKAYGFSGDDLEKHDTRVQRLLGSVDPDLARDTASGGTQLMLTLGKDVYLVRKCAMPSVYESAMISGKSLGLMDPAARSSTLNHCLHVAQGGSTALIRAGKLSALLSDGYVVMDSMRVYETAERAIRNRMGTPDFRSGRITHSYSDMLLELPDIQDKFLALLPAGGYILDFGPDRNCTAKVIQRNSFIIFYRKICNRFTIQRDARAMRFGISNRKTY